ncbi:serpin family protein [Proteiniclasticum sp. QWL-01]|uniref:serpin family protein n=1 Tax=Proteiniclasticum sp. QWL-01 TaxID=3036945 RepID=UPI00240FFD9E|nr:serpin family protein [Proteiniclasticum sp. QWL-01]WFF72896.1 serpin family protein [Proteiniclasticum sp. QWL-01]
MEDYEATFETDGSAILNIYNVLYLTDLVAGSARSFKIRPSTLPPVTSRFPLWADWPMGRTLCGSCQSPGGRLPRRTGHPGLVPPAQGRSRTAGSDSRAGLDSVRRVPGRWWISKAPALDINGENLSLKKLLIDKGYTNMFLSADLSNMLSGVTASVTEIKQKTKLQLDEKGFKAAAVTEIGVGKTSLPGDNKIEFTLDRPYLLVIEYQGLPLIHIPNPGSVRSVGHPLTNPDPRYPSPRTCLTEENRLQCKRPVPD